MDHRDVATSRMKRKYMKRHPSDLDLTLRMCFIGFSSLDEWLRLNHFKKNFQCTSVHHIPLVLSEDQRHSFNVWIRRSTQRHVTCTW